MKRLLIAALILLLPLSAVQGGPALSSQTDVVPHTVVQQFKLDLLEGISTASDAYADHSCDDCECSDTCDDHAGTDADDHVCDCVTDECPGDSH